MKSALTFVWLWAMSYGLQVVGESPGQRLNNHSENCYWLPGGIQILSPEARYRSPIVGGNEFPKIHLKDIDNKMVLFSEIARGDFILVISFWATWCKPCMEELNIINDNLEKWLSVAKFRFIAISIDDSRSGTKVKSLVDGRGWSFKVLIDQNQELKRYYGVNSIPCTLIFKYGNLVSRYVGYSPGNEIQFLKELEKLNEQVIHF